MPLTSIYTLRGALASRPRPRALNPWELIRVTDGKAAWPRTEEQERLQLTTRLPARQAALWQLRARQFTADHSGQRRDSVCSRH